MYQVHVLRLGGVHEDEEWRGCSAGSRKGFKMRSKVHRGRLGLEMTYHCSYPSSSRRSSGREDAAQSCQALGYLASNPRTGVNMVARDTVSRPCTYPCRNTIDLTKDSVTQGYIYELGGQTVWVP